MRGNPPSATSATLPILAVAAGATERIRMVSSVLLVPFYQALRPDDRVEARDSKAIRQHGLKEELTTKELKLIDGCGSIPHGNLQYPLKKCPSTTLLGKEGLPFVPELSSLEKFRLAACGKCTEAQFGSPSIYHDSSLFDLSYHFVRWLLPTSHGKDGDVFGQQFLPKT